MKSGHFLRHPPLLPGFMSFSKQTQLLDGVIFVRATRDYSALAVIPDRSGKIARSGGRG
jgi:hypothetical protein